MLIIGQIIVALIMVVPSVLAWIEARAARQQAKLATTGLAEVKETNLAQTQAVEIVREDGVARDVKMDDLKARADEHAEKLETVRLDVNDKLQQFLKTMAAANYAKGLLEARKMPSDRTGPTETPEPREVTHPGQNPTPQTSDRP